MTLDRARRKELYNLCNPDVEVGPTDPRNVDLDSNGGRGDRRSRGGWAARLASDFELADAPLLRLVSGLPGSGKSTELLRLASLLEDPDGAHLLPVLIDAEALLSLRVPIDAPDLLVLLVHQTERAVVLAEGGDPQSVWAHGPFSRLWAFLSRTDVVPGKGELSVAPVKLGFELKTNPDLRARIRDSVRGQRTEFLIEVREACEALQKRAIALGYNGLVLLVDSLEKIRGMTDDFEQVLASAERLFADGAPDLELPVHVLYTVPPTVVLRIQTDIRILPMIKLRSRDGVVHAPGFAAAEEMIRRRLQPADLDAIFGAPSVGARIRELISASGGYPREIVRLLRAVLAEGAFPLGEAELQSVLLEMGEPYRRVALAHGVTGVRLLARLHVEKRFVVDATEREMVDHLVANNLVLRYRNDTDWVDLHPAVLHLDLVKRAIAELRASGGALGPAVGTKPV